MLKTTKLLDILTFGKNNSNKIYIKFGDNDKKLAKKSEIL